MTDIISWLVIFLITGLKVEKSDETNYQDVFDLDCGFNKGCWLGSNFKVSWEPYKLRLYSTIGQFVMADLVTNTHGNITLDKFEILLGLSHSYDGKFILVENR